MSESIATEQPLEEPLGQPLDQPKRSFLSREWLFKWFWIGVCLAIVGVMASGQLGSITSPIMSVALGCDISKSDSVTSENGRAEAHVESYNCDRIMGTETRVRAGRSSFNITENLFGGSQWTLLSVDGPSDDVSVEWDGNTLVVYYPDSRDVNWKGQVSDDRLKAHGADVVYVPVYD